MSNGNSITGRKKHNMYDFYETPKWATEEAINAMLRDGYICKKDNILEPCSGAGAISDVFEKYGFTDVNSSDIQTANFIKGKKGINIYDIEDNSYDVIFTNPPYNLMTRKEKDGGSLLKEFLRISRKRVILLVNVFFLSSKDRKELLENSHLRHMYIHSKRVTMYPFGEEKPKNGGTKMFVWLVWDNEYNDIPTFTWI